MECPSDGEGVVLSPVIVARALALADVQLEDIDIQPARLPFSLFVKSLVIGTPLERAGLELRWALGSLQRFRHPELWELYLEERRLPFVLQRLLSSNSCGVDVGSHVGGFLSLLQKYAPAGSHVAFEPSVQKSAWLARRFPNVKIYSLAVGEKPGAAIFEENEKLPGFSRLLNNSSSGQTSINPSYEVSVCTLDDTLANKRVDFIKIDVEGNELEVLKGAASIIKRSEPSIMFECGDEYSLSRRNISRKELFDFITKTFSYNIYTISDFLYGKKPMDHSEFDKCGSYPFRALNFLALPAAKQPPVAASPGSILNYAGVPT